MKLYQITEQYQNLLELLDSPDFATNPDVLTALENIDDDFQQKGVQLVHHIKNQEGEIEMLDAEIKRLQALKVARTKQIAWLKNYLKTNMDATGIDKIECPLFKITLSKPSLNTVEITNEQALPVKYLRTKIEPDKTAIKQALKDGEYIDGARLVETRTLRIS
ncbi:siphovirus Gp157 family protein [Pasteurellaceae bacterium 20609_3]|uniref:siphovirus Gp157 family protein n=1 Tax=Spirabiliibacterium mucosae TaxID=28156 RepID=UPI001AADA0F3|nr:siphovirus Gp157 family protein [Spirabiliibacterium mucosae]MBE2898117.1 siphovirus Gp157 family protein [Spirabiliibacterium mucosae]